MILTYGIHKNIIIAFDKKIKIAKIFINDMNDNLIEELTLTDVDFKNIYIDKDIDKVKLRIEVDDLIVQKEILLN